MKNLSIITLSDNTVYNQNKVVKHNNYISGIYSLPTARFDECYIVFFCRKEEGGHIFCYRADYNGKFELATTQILLTPPNVLIKKIEMCEHAFFVKTQVDDIDQAENEKEDFIRLRLNIANLSKSKSGLTVSNTEDYFRFREAEIQVVDPNSVLKRMEKRNHKLQLQKERRAKIRERLAKENNTSIQRRPISLRNIDNLGEVMSNREFSVVASKKASLLGDNMQSAQNGSAYHSQLMMPSVAEDAELGLIQSPRDIGFTSQVINSDIPQERKVKDGMGTSKILA